MTLEDQIIDFLSSLPYIDELDGKIETPDSVKIADYLFFNKTVVTELKTLQSDPSEKLQERVQELMKDTSFPLIFGEFDIHTAINQMPNGKKINRKLYERAMRQIEGIVRQANKQIQSTKSFLKLPDSTLGMLLIVNDFVTTLPANEIVNRVTDFMNQKVEGALRFSEIDLVCIIQNVYEYTTEQDKQLPLYVVVNTNKVPADTKKQEIDTFIKDWCKYNGYNYAKKDEDDTPLKLSDRYSTPPANVQEVIEERYRQNRKLKNLSEDELIQYGRELHDQMFSAFAKGSTTPKNNRKLLFISGIEFYEESRLRSFDMRKLGGV